VLSEAARTVGEAGDLELASRNFKSGARMIDSSAEQRIRSKILRRHALRSGIAPHVVHLVFCGVLLMLGGHAHVLRCPRRPSRRGLDMLSHELSTET
jgi:hypothetical protein